MYAGVKGVGYKDWVQGLGSLRVLGLGVTLWGVGFSFPLVSYIDAYL